MFNFEPCKYPILRGGVYFIKDRTSQKNPAVMEHPYMVISKNGNIPVIVAPLSSHYKDIPTGLPCITLSKDGRKVLSYINAFPVYMSQDAFTGLYPAFIMPSEFVDFIVRIIKSNYEEDETLKTDLITYKNNIKNMGIKEYHEEYGYVTRTESGAFIRTTEHPKPEKSEVKKPYYIKPKEQEDPVLPKVQTKKSEDDEQSASDSETAFYMLSQKEGFSIILNATAPADEKLQWIIDNDEEALKCAKSICFEKYSKNLPDDKTCEEFLRICIFYGYKTISEYVGTSKGIVHIRCDQISKKIGKAVAEKVILSAERYKSSMITK